LPKKKQPKNVFSLILIKKFIYKSWKKKKRFK